MTVAAPEPLTLPAPTVGRRPSSASLVLALTGQGLRSFLRSPVAAFFTVGLPLMFLLVIAAIFGNEVVDVRGGIRVAQFYTPAMAVFGATEAAFCFLAVDTTRLREQGVFQRLLGTPVRPGLILAGRICAAALVALAAAVLVLTAGVLLYHVQIVWRAAAAAVVTLLVGIGCFAALGLAVVGLVRGAANAQAVTNGLLIPLAFISDVFSLTSSPTPWLQTLGWWLPLKHFANAMAGAFDPHLSGTGFATDHLAVLAAWGTAASLLAWRTFRWEARPARTGSASRWRPARRVALAAAAGPLAATVSGRPSPVASLSTQLGYALRSLARNPSGVFFSVPFPALLLIVFPLLSNDRRAAAAQMLPAMTAYGMAIAGYAMMPASIAEPRASGVLQRLRGTPMPPWSFVAGRMIAAATMGLATTLLLVAVAGIGFGTGVDAGRLPALALGLLATAACAAALGFAALTVLRNAQAITAATIGSLLLLGFVSDMFIMGATLPGWLAAVAGVFPVKHMVRVLNQALLPGITGAGFAWSDLAVLAAWTAAGLLVARRMPWQARR